MKMRFKIWSVPSILLLLLGSNDARPSKIANAERIDEKTSLKGINDFSSSSSSTSSTWKPIEPRSPSIGKTDSRTELKDLQYMDQSLRTVATQLLNVTNPKDSIENRKIASNEKIATNVLLVEKNISNNNNNSNDDNNNNKKTIPSPARFANSDKSDTESSVGFGRPVNSKFGYFESSHPGQAMALTEEELERELSMLAGGPSTRLMTAHKNHPTTTGGISTWILLNPPTTTSTTSKTAVDKSGQTKVSPSAENLNKTLKKDATSATNLQKIGSTTPMERIVTASKNTTSGLKRTTSPISVTTEKMSVTTEASSKIEKTRLSSLPGGSSTAAPSGGLVQTRNSTTTERSVLTTKKPLDGNRTTVKPRITTPKATNVTSKPMSTKLTRPVNHSTKIRTTTRKPTTRIPMETTKNPSTSKIEKVTFRPVEMITTPKNGDDRTKNQVPIFMTKIKTSFVTDPVENPMKNSIVNATDDSYNKDNKILEPEVNTDSSIFPKTKRPTRTNNVLKVQLKKPVELATNIEIEPIKVNAPILKIEKMENTDRESASKENSTRRIPILEDSRIDVKFQFNPEIKKIDKVETKIEEDTTTTTTTTTRRPHKRKKNKLRRRKPTTQAPSSVVVSTTGQPISSAIESLSTTSVSSSTESLDRLTEVSVIDNTIQESKIAPESKVTSGNENNNNTKNKKKQVQKPIGTQIYNFLSREVMPSFGVMSLVGLGLGLASYFLYPFSGSIARRNYVVEPNYKYNMDEYGGNYGQNEEEVFSKVLQGMTNQDGKYGGIKDYENNFYRYQQSYDGSYIDSNRHSTKRIFEPTRHSTVASTIYHSPEMTKYNEKYRNTDLKYSLLPTTDNYYEKKSDFVGKNSGEREFVVGNVPKEYGYEKKNHLPPQETMENLSTKMEDESNYEKDVKDSLGSEEEMESTASAVQVEHGPRSIVEETMRKIRKKRESVIQTIPSRTELEKEEKEIEKEEPLSNEILDIIDSVIPEVTIKEKGKNDFTIKSIVEESTTTATTTASGIKEDVAEDEGTISSTEMNLAASDDREEMKNDKINNSISDSLDFNESVISTTATTSSTTTTTVQSLTIEEILGTTGSNNDDKNSSDESIDSSTTDKPSAERFNIFSFVKKLAEVKLRLGVAILKHASEGFARYLGHVQKRINGEE